jgi:PAS domain S-box-containing protein
MNPLKILHLEDNQHDADLVEATLASGGLETAITRVETRDAFEHALATGQFDIVLCDYNLPAFDGRSAQVLHSRLGADVPFIFLSGSIGEELAVERLKEGATDYVLKDRMARLPSAVRRALAEAEERRERLRAQQEILRLNADLERRVAERTAALAESERRLQAILTHSPAAISLKDTSGRYILANQEFERLAGVAPAGSEGRTDAELFPPRLAQTYRVNDAEALERPHGLEIEEVFLLPDGPHIYHSIKFPVQDADGRAYALCTIGIDITEQKKANDALKIARLEAERLNRAKSDFLSRMSHDLRTPLNAILGFAQLLELEELGADKHESVSQILRAGQHLLGLINEVLDIARIEAGHLSLSPEPVHARELVQIAVDLVRPLAVERGIALQVADVSSDVMVFADRQRLTQILLNLLSNAVKYNRPKGRVTVGFQPVDSGRLRIAVTDTGAGIPPSKLALLFQPFERLGADQTAIEGTGLGLALSRGLAEAMDGTVGVESVVDQGSTFFVELALTSAPTVTESAAASGGPVDAALPPASGLVLYIEDNRSNVRLMERLLQRRPNVRLLHAATGEEGLSLARETQPDLILLDLHLPDMPGTDVLHHLWQDAAMRRIPVAILSADATPAQARRLKASGAVAYLTKPLEIREVVKLIDERLGAGLVPGATS